MSEKDAKTGYFWLKSFISASMSGYALANLTTAHGACEGARDNSEYLKSRQSYKADFHAVLRSVGEVELT